MTGPQLKKIRTGKLNISIETLAKRLKIHRHTVWRWENGSEIPALSSVALDSLLTTAASRRAFLREEAE